MKRNPLRTNTAALATVCTSSCNVECTDNVEHFFFKGIHVCLLGTVKLGVSDRFCFGSTPGREVIELNDDRITTEAFTNLNVGYASALAMLLFVVMAIFSWLNIRVMNKFDS